MIKLFSTYFIIIILISAGFVYPTLYAHAEESAIPVWVKNTMQWYLDGAVSEKEMIAALQFLIKEKVINLEEKTTQTTNDGNWLTGIQDTLTSAVKEIQGNPTADLVVKSILPVIPVAGPLLANLYENASGSTSDKNAQILKILEEYQKMDNVQLEKSFAKLEENKELIKTNQYKLNEVLIDTKLLLTGQEDIKNLLKVQGEQIAALLAANGIDNKIDRSKIGTISQETQIKLKEQQKEIAQLKSQIEEATGEKVQVDIEQLETLANAQLYAENDEEAIEIYEEILKSDPNNFDALNGIGWALVGLDKSAESIEWFKKALAIDGEDAETLEGLGWAYLDSVNPDEAIKWFDKAIDADPGNPFAYEGKAYALMDLERWGEAESTCEKGLEVDPGNEYLLQCVTDAQTNF
jgi:tetratricopeptide (TPR) repeat protein